MLLSCFHCQETYDTAKSTAKQDINMYCSFECEEEEFARLVEGNGIIASAETNNPFAFGRSNLEQARISTSKSPSMSNFVDVLKSVKG